jgi:electron transfer flavoprotein alpha subunit
VTGDGRTGIDGPAGTMAVAGAGAVAVAVVVVRDGRLPAGALETVAEAGGAVVLVGTGAGESVAADLHGARQVWWAPTPTDPALLAGILAPALAPAQLVLLPASPDGRDLAPRLAAAMGRPLLAGAVRASVVDGRVDAELLRVDGRVIVPVFLAGEAVATMWPGSRASDPTGPAPEVRPLHLPAGADRSGSVETLGLVEPDPATMDLADAHRVLAGGAGLVPDGASDAQARAVFALLTDVASALGASAGATRVVTDAGWMAYDRQIGTTGVTLQPDLYVALGISGASQHLGGIGDPERVVSVNVDPSCPMTGRADLGLVADAPGLLLELADRLGVPIPAEVAEMKELRSEL